MYGLLSIDQLCDMENPKNAVHMEPSSNFQNYSLCPYPCAALYLCHSSWSIEPSLFAAALELTANNMPISGIASVKMLTTYLYKGFRHNFKIIQKLKNNKLQ